VRRLQRLSAREREVLAALGRGFSTRRIAEELRISPDTVRNHVRSLLGKLRVHRRLEAVLIWLDRSG
jgi:two-component system nitrate/nitrite response regulator NarL